MTVLSGRPSSYTCIMSSYLLPLIAVILSYLLGSVSFGILVATSKGVNIRTHGSGNPGTANIMRVLGKESAIVVLLGDGIKGVAAAGAGVALWGPEFGYVTVMAAVIGHTFPIWHGFKGGKSVATAVGGIIHLAPLVGLVLVLLWGIIVALWKTASVASIAVMVTLVPLLWFAGRSTYVLVWAAAISVFVIVRHASNIRRLLTSSEQRVTG